ncbi:hypothetical protein N7509_005986 [Penicillium cosmopolitanum]|uniref:Uncharacterized protein n=1 Tax=Penicillium cosmopolitanum TaxID=1131564 RepID=A0A9W9W3K8_9EURO|nr:uncharacterized protein N7509_005986 [Penicillium cosmopolitanum]KAJ5397873.1 hypothetical protein N7509_005986 [Penicillium cosmopolitanum]
MGTEIYEIAVYGSTSGAVASAIQAARLGRKTVLISPHEHIGGIQVEGLGSTDIDNQIEFKNSPSVGGLALELHRRLSKQYGRLERLEEVLQKGEKVPEVWKFESHILEQVILSWLAEFPSLSVFKGSLRSDSSAVEKSGNTVTALRLTNGKTIRSKYFIEASYEGDFFVAAGISTALGRESSAQYDESLAGVRDDTRYTQFEVPVDPYVVPGDPSSRLLYGISPEPFEGYERSHYDLHRRYLKAGGKMYTPRIKGIPNRKTDLIGSEAVLCTDLLGMNDGWPTADAEDRQKILDETATFTQGLIWFFANEKLSLPIFAANGLDLATALTNSQTTTISLDSFTFAMHGEWCPTMLLQNTPLPSMMEKSTIYAPSQLHTGLQIHIAHVEWSEIVSHIMKASYSRTSTSGGPLVSLIGPCSSRVGYGAVRIEHQFYELGQACANACDIALNDVGTQGSVQDVPYSVLRERLLDQEAVLDVSLVGKPDFSLL